MPLPKRLRKTGLALVLAAPLAAHPQTNPFGGLPNNAQNPTAAQQSTTSQTVSGTVVDATTGQGIFRVLVQLTVGGVQRAVLTDAEGRFTFANVTPSNGNNRISFTKPGYSDDPSGFVATSPPSIGWSGSVIPTPIQFTLYPEAILKGTVKAPDGTPIPNLMLDAIRVAAGNGFNNFLITNSTRTNDQGKFRMTVPAGRYRIQSNYLAPHSSAPDAYAVMPVVYPESSAPNDSTLRLQPGEQRDIDLHPTLAPILDVLVHSPSFHDFSSVSAITADGAPFPVRFTPTNGARGGRGASVSFASDFEAKMPAGDYTLRAITRGFAFGGNSADDAIQQAPVSLIPTQQRPVNLTLQFATVSPIPVEFTLEDSSQSTTTGTNWLNQRSFALALEPVAADPPITSQFLRIRRRSANDFSFLAPPGSYRLRDIGNYGSYIVSATYGGNDVLSHPLQIAAGTGSTPLRIVVSTRTASLRGKVTISSTPAQAYLYFISNHPTENSLRMERTSADGSYSIANLSPGDYRVLALASKRPIDANNPASYEAYSSQIGSISLQPGDTQSLDLQAVPEQELRP